MVGIGETYFPAFVLALGLGGVTAGLVASIPLLAGAVLQLVSPHAVRALGSHRRWVLGCAVGQAFAFVPFVVGALAGGLPAAAVFVAASFYWALGQGTGPAWNTWMDRLVPRRVRARYFAARNRVAQIFVLLGLLAGGALLELGTAHGAKLAAFGALFTAAALARLVSAHALAKQSEPPALEIERPVPVVRFAARLWSGQDGRLVLYMVALQTAVYVAGPYFNPFMLAELELSYARYMTLVATAFGARILLLPVFGLWAKRYGARRVLWAGGLGIVPLSALWLLSSEFAYLIVLQALSGAAWGAYELATQLLFFEMIRRDERTSVLTYFNLVNAVAIVAGSLAGAAVMAGVGGHAGYLAVFAISFAGRAASLLLLRRIAPAPQRLTRLVMRILAVRPEGSIERPVISSIEERRPPAADDGHRRARHLRHDRRSS